MIPAIRAEFKKVFTVRATYVVMLAIAALLVFFAFYVSGWKASTANLHDPLYFANDVTSAIAAVSVFISLIALLLVTHEYRYNTIAYTLTASNSRTKVLLAKTFVVSVIAIIAALIIGFLSPVLSYWGASVHHLHFVPQVIHHANLVWRSIFFSWGYTMAGLLIALFIRNQIGAVVVLFIAPDTVEGLLSLLLKHNTVYLPFTSLTVVIGQTQQPTFANVISPAKAALVFATYVVVGLIVAWVLFLRRDAMN